MIDIIAAFRRQKAAVYLGMALDFSQDVPPDVVAADDPSVASISCRITNDVGDNYVVDIERPEALLLSAGPGAVLRTRVFGLTTGQAHACRAQVLQSFVWNQHCAPALE